MGKMIMSGAPSTCHPTPFRRPEVAATSFRDNAAIVGPSGGYSPLCVLNVKPLGLRQLPSTIKIFGCDCDLARAPRRAISPTLWQTLRASYERDEIKKAAV